MMYGRIVCRKDSRLSPRATTCHGHTAVVCVLLEAKADSNVTKNVIAQDARVLLVRPHTVAWSAAFFAAKSGHLESAVELLSVARADGRTHNQVCIYGIL